jgi:metal-sulfur cluster biosynthetic enzyme
MEDLEPLGVGARLAVELDREGRPAATRPGASSSSGRHLGRARLVFVPTKEEVVEVLRGVEDPELGMDIVDLGLMYDVEVDGSNVKVLHSLTSMGCPAGPMIQEGIHEAVAALPGVENVQVELTWDPPWTPEKMSDDAKFILGFG